MQAVAGVFRTREDAAHGFRELRRAGFSPDDINLLSPGSPADAAEAIPVSETEQPGVGKAIGGVVGAALGMAGGFELGVGVTALVPGVGPVLAAGLAGMALLGIGGAAAGAKAGEAAERKSTPGLPADEVFFYEDAVRQGRTVIIVMANGATEGRRAQEILAEAGAEALDAARRAWWIGLRDAESEHYQALGYNFEADHETYRAGFEAALRRDLRGRSYSSASSLLKNDYPAIWEHEAFRAGYARGQEYVGDRAAAPHTP
jgi:hypothetical protein